MNFSFPFSNCAVGHVFRLHKLRRLALSDNEIYKVPADISNLSELEDLDLSKNGNMDRLIDVVSFLYSRNSGQHKAMSKFTLRRFEQQPNKQVTSTLPECVFQLGRLTSLGLNDISMTNLPTDIGKLTNLETLGS
ncbi:conserved hypothetical protein [Trichinella spiralis]|uniref:hypothetical protein n=1 Tax=Trichinella spiralis TaxID=6334 RepID=UPI0001EFEA0C|nr:conserved hypothetical protein [Trichinella spiralis]